jgi:hypothetical protein
MHAPAEVTQAMQCCNAMAKRCTAIDGNGRLPGATTSARIDGYASAQLSAMPMSTSSGTLSW